VVQSNEEVRSLSYPVLFGGGDGGWMDGGANVGFFLWAAVTSPFSIGVTHFSKRPPPTT